MPLPGSVLPKARVTTRLRILLRERMCFQRPILCRTTNNFTNITGTRALHQAAPSAPRFLALYAYPASARTLWYRSELGSLSGRCRSCHTTWLRPTSRQPRQKAAGPRVHKHRQQQAVDTAGKQRSHRIPVWQANRLSCNASRKSCPCPHVQKLQPSAGPSHPRLPPRTLDCCRADLQHLLQPRVSERRQVQGHEHARRVQADVGRRQRHAEQRHRAAAVAHGQVTQVGGPLQVRGAGAGVVRVGRQRGLPRPSRWKDSKRVRRMPYCRQAFSQSVPEPVNGRYQLV